MEKDLSAKKSEGINCLNKEKENLPLDKINFFIESFIKRGEKFKKPELLSSVDTVGDFFRHFHTIFEDNYHNLIINKTIHIMKDGIEPIWESEQNMYGGIMTFVVYLKNVKQSRNKNGTNNLLDFYLDILLLFIGNTFREKCFTVEDDINGISFSKRKFKVLIKVWHKNSDRKDTLEDLIKNELLEKSLKTMEDLEIYSYYQIINQKADFDVTKKNK